MIPPSRVFMQIPFFRELEEWSSLVALSVIAMVDEIYGVTINGEDMRNAQTVGDLFESVQNKK